ncbi:MAG: hypothetical protein OEZ39_14915 [Gammaproteobacteria bacterium]|nr:hypothetical protein [Gammaproteobacteria bacterium]MDH5653144.1 hypothetical protein [Gammaproteobacteria bacterium]
MSETHSHEDIFAVINLLAGAAQAGAKGLLAQAAYNVMKASEAVAKAKNLELDQSIQDRARDALNNAQSTLLKASTVPGAMDEAKQDIINADRQTYQIAEKL